MLMAGGGSGHVRSPARIKLLTDSLALLDLLAPVQPRVLHVPSCKSGQVVIWKWL